MPIYTAPGQHPGLTTLLAAPETWRAVIAALPVREDMFRRTLEARLVALPDTGGAVRLAVTMEEAERLIAVATAIGA